MTRALAVALTLSLLACSGKKAPEPEAPSAPEAPVAPAAPEAPATPAASAPGVDAKGVLLNPAGVCTQMFCPPEDKCCNSCGHTAWMGGTGLYIEDVSEFKVTLDGCGKSDKQLWATVEGEGMDAKITSGRLVETRTFDAMAACTKMLCPEDNQCCNSCSFSAWVSDGKKLVGDDLPKPEVDGCGATDKKVSATGWVEGDTFVPLAVREAE